MADGVNTMKDVKAAADVVRRLEEARANKKALDEQHVVGVLLHHDKNRADDPIVLRQGTYTGTGSVTSIGFPPELQAQLQEGLRAYANKAVKDLEAALKAFGVEP